MAPNTQDTLVDYGPSSSKDGSGSSSTRQDPDLEKAQISGDSDDDYEDVAPDDRTHPSHKPAWEDDDAPDDDAPKNLQLRRQHTVTFGKLKLRAADDDLPQDWWFASTAIPLIAATFAPMANLFSIAALVIFWRADVTTDDSTTRQSTATGYKDPAWCYNLNVASLICGFLGNLFLLFNFTRRVRYIVALPATILLFYIACGILTGITASMAIYTPPGENQVYSQGFFYAVIAACLYLLNSMMLMANMLGYFLGHYPQHFNLTDEQRNLILQTMMFFIWLGGGGAVFANVCGWSYPDALYFCDVTILTIGFGDFTAPNDVGRGLVFPYSVGGIIILGLMVSSINKFAGELSKDNVLRKHVESRRVNTLSRSVADTTEDDRRKHLENEIKDMHGIRPSISSPLADPEIQRRLDDEREKKEAQAARAQVGFHIPEKPTEEEEDLPSPHQFLNSPLRPNWATRTFNMVIAPVTAFKKVRDKNRKLIIMREEKDRFDAMRKIQEDAKNFKKWYALALSVIAFGVLWCVGAVVFWRAERETQGFTYFQALYFCYVSLLTIGYGDLSPKSNLGKPFFVLWSLVAIPTMTILISDMGDTVIASFKRGTFKLADFTVLPKAGLWHNVLASNPWLMNWAKKQVDKKRRKTGLPVGVDAPAAVPSIQQLAEEDLSDANLTRQLAFAIRRTADDLARHHDKRYGYEEWVEFTRLIRFTKLDLDALEYDESQEGVVEWDWLDEHSPMLSEQSESEWVLDRLCESLLRWMKKTRKGDDASLLGAGKYRHHRHGERSGNDQSPDTPPEPSQDMTPMTERQKRTRRAVGADGLLTFFTGNRKGTQAYAFNEPQWSKKAHERQAHERRKSSQTKARRGPFAVLGHHKHKLATGAMGGGRGGAGVKTLKARTMSLAV